MPINSFVLFKKICNHRIDSKCHYRDPNPHRSCNDCTETYCPLVNSGMDQFYELERPEHCYSSESNQIRLFKALEVLNAKLNVILDKLHERPKRDWRCNHKFERRPDNDHYTNIEECTKCGLWSGKKRSAT